MLPDLRIIDANANRAREGLRFLEDHARFEINDADLARTFKTLRHDLTSAVAAMLSAANADTTALLASRDTPGDVGTMRLFCSAGPSGPFLLPADFAAARSAPPSAPTQSAPAGTAITQVVTAFRFGIATTTPYGKDRHQLWLIC